MAARDGPMSDEQGRPVAARKVLMLEKSSPHGSNRVDTRQPRRKECLFLRIKHDDAACFHGYHRRFSYYSPSFQRSFRRFSSSFDKPGQKSSEFQPQRVRFYFP